MRKFWNKINNNIYFQLLFYISIPSIVIILVLIASIFLYNSHYLKITNNTNLTTLEHFGKQQDKAMDNISLSFSALQEDVHFFNTVNGSLNSLSDITYSQKVLKNIKLKNTQIAKISVFNKDTMQVFTNNNVYSAQEYFEQEHIYDNYTLDYWKRYLSPLSEKAVLAPSSVTDDDIISTVIPVVFTRIGNKHLKTIIIVDINLSSIISAYDNYKFSENTKFYMLNKETGQLFDSTNVTTAEEDFFNTVYKEQSAAFDYKTISNNYVLSYTPRFSSLGYSYIAMIPYKDIYRATLSFTLMLITAVLIILLIMILLIAKLAKKASLPYNKIAHMFGVTDKENDLNEINSLISTAIESNIQLSSTISRNLPALEENYLIHILNSSEHYTEAESPFSFEYDYFCSVIIRFEPKENFREKYNAFDVKSIELSLFNIFKLEFESKFRTYVVPSDEHTMYIILNLENDQCADELAQTVDFIHNIMQNDADDLKLTIACGDILSGISGLKTSHKNALKILTGTKWINESYIKTDSEHKKNQNIKFSQADEILIYDHLITGHIDTAIEIINKITENNSNATTSAAIRFYMQIFNLIFKVMHSKKIVYDTNNVGDIEIINDILSHNTTEIHGTMLELLNLLRNHTNYSKTDTASILEYINKNYEKNETLETIAAKFNVSPSHFSKLIKKETSSTFTDYVNSLRVREAKHLLETTNISITEIHEKVGITSRTTFIRVFKNSTGVTPSEYRKNAKL